jgi:hypothetical protein
VKCYQSIMLRLDRSTGLFHQAGTLVPVLAEKRHHALMKLQLSDLPKATWPDAWLCVYDQNNPEDSIAAPHSVHDNPQEVQL